VIDAAPVVAVVALVAGIFAGEHLGPSPAAVPLVVVAAAACVALTTTRSRRRRIAAVVAVGFLGMALMQRATHGLVDSPLAPLVRGRADVAVRGTLVDDPDGSRFATRVLVRLDTVRVVGRGWEDAGGRTVLVVADAEAAPRLALLDAGDDVVLRGWLRPLEPYDEWLRWRHAVGRLDAHDLTRFGSPTAAHLQVANALRGVVLHGTSVLPETQRGLVAGFLLGDTRALPDDVLEQFRAAGLSHLLAVSGANVAFALALVGPGLRRLPRVSRLLVTLAALALFGAMTRWEPSVLRATAMAACSVLALHSGRPIRTTRVLAIAVVALLLLDPFLVHSVGFQLSCGASLGIALLTPRFLRWMRGPPWLRECLSVTAAAQVGVAPVLLPVFGTMPLVALPANLLAVPVAGPLTTYGLGAGAIAGLLDDVAPGLAHVVQLPTRVMSGAILGIANAASRVPLAVDMTSGVGMSVVVLAAVLLRRRRMLRRDAPFVSAR
jgi:competence protein ComEC